MAAGQGVESGRSLRTGPSSRGGQPHLEPAQRAVARPRPRRFLEHLAVRVEPGDPLRRRSPAARTLCGRAPAGEQFAEPLEQRVDALAGHRRDRHDRRRRSRRGCPSSSSRRSASSRSHLFHTSRIGIAAVPPSSSITPEIAEHLEHLALLRRAVGIGDVAHVEDHVGRGHFLQRRAERGDQLGRQVGDEARPCRTGSPCRPRAARSRAWSDRAWRTAGPPPSRRRRSGG